MNTETELKIRWLISQKEAAIAEANMELNRGGWTIGWNFVLREIDAEIEKLLNPPSKVKPPTAERGCPFDEDLENQGDLEDGQ